MAKVNVQLSATGPIEEMDEADLEKHEGVDTSDHRGDAHWTDYWLPGTFYEVGKPDPGYVEGRVHRSVHMKLKSHPT